MTPPQPLSRGSSDALAGRAPHAFVAAPQYDELAIGFECAHPSLQIERWETPEDDAEGSFAAY